MYCLLYGFNILLFCIFLYCMNTKRDWLICGHVALDKQVCGHKIEVYLPHACMQVGGIHENTRENLSPGIHENKL